MVHSNRDYRNALWLAILLPVVLLLGAVIVKAIGQEFFSRHMPVCVFHLLTGWNCISCGATRATFALLRGDLRTAVYYNPLYILFLLWGAWLYLRLVLSLAVRPYRKFSLNITLPQAIALSAVLIGYVILRNTPFFRAIFY